MEEERELRDRGLSDFFYKLNQMYAPKEEINTRINMDDFSRVPGFDVSADKAKIYDKKIRHEFTDATSLGKFAENFIMREINRLQILGDSKAVLGSEYDDLFNGADIVVEIKGAETINRFSVDISTGDSASILRKTSFQKKLANVGDIGQVKYFRSQYDRGVVGLPSAPHLVLSINPDDIIDFLEKSKPLLLARRTL